MHPNDSLSMDYDMASWVGKLVSTLHLVTFLSPFKLDIKRKKVSQTLKFNLLDTFYTWQERKLTTKRLYLFSIDSLVSNADRIARFRPDHGLLRPKERSAAVGLAPHLWMGFDCARREPCDDFSWAHNLRNRCRINVSSSTGWASN